MLLNECVLPTVHLSKRTQIQNLIPRVNQLLPLSGRAPWVWWGGGVGMVGEGRGILGYFKKNAAVKSGPLQNL